MKKIVIACLALVLCVVLAAPALAITLPSAPAPSAVHEQLEVALGEDTAGAAVLVLENGQKTMIEGFGYADITQRQLVTADTAFEIGALSGLFVLLSVHELVQQGLVDLTQDITMYLPQDFSQKLGLSYRTTLSDLLYGVAGFEGRTFDLRYNKDAYAFDTLSEALLAEVPAQIATPGTYHSYSAFGIGLAALVVECVSGQPYDEYVQQRILAPLGMKDTVLNPRADTLPSHAAKGHTVLGEGSFALARRDGRSYAGVYPANGALSTVADLSLLLSHLTQSDVLGTYGTRANGVFQVGPVGLIESGSVLHLHDTTLCFGASIALNPADGRAVLVLANTTQSSLLTLPAKVLDATSGVHVESAGELPELKQFKGVYADASLRRESLVGRLAMKDANQKVTVDDDAIVFLGMTLRQIGPGVFADVEDEAGLAVVQFLLDDEGEVSAIVCADGTTYLPLAFIDRAPVAMLLLGVMVILSLYFLLGAAFSTVGAVSATLGGDRRSWRFVFPWIFSALIGLLALLQLLVGVRYGSMAIASFFTAMSVLCLIFIIAAVASTLFAFLTPFGERNRTSRTANGAMLLVVLILACVYWRVIRFS